MEQPFKGIQEFLWEFYKKTTYLPRFIVTNDFCAFLLNGRSFYANTILESANSLIDEFFNSGIIVQEIREHLKEFASRHLDF